MNKILMALLSKLDNWLFAYQVKHGFILCAVESEEDSEEEQQEESEESGESESSEETEENTEESEEPEEVVIQIGDEEPEESEHAAAPAWVKDLRKSYRDSQKRIKELETQLSTGEQAQAKVKKLGEKPKLENFEYDSDEYEKALEKWHEDKRAIEAEEKRIQAEAENANRAWQETLNGYTKAKTELKVKDFEDAEDLVKDSLSVTQQGIILQGCKNSALVIYALGKNSKKLKELAAITDPVKYAFAVANLENQLKVNPKKAPPPPEKTVSGKGAVSGAVDSQLERLRNEAEKTGDYSKVMQYRQQLRNKQK